ncbi:hypothetical protein Plhal304r1_c055g0140771 [Plasmopara halstedii]
MLKTYCIASFAIIRAGIEDSIVSDFLAILCSRNKVFFRLDFAPRNNLATLAFQELELKRYPSENNVTDEPRRSASLPPPTLFVID